MVEDLYKEADYTLLAKLSYDLKRTRKSVSMHRMILIKGRNHVSVYQESAVTMLSIQWPSNTAAVILRTLINVSWNTSIMPLNVFEDL